MSVRDFIERGLLQGQTETLGTGNCIFKQGEKISFLYLVTQGSVTLADNKTGIDEQVVAPPDFLLGITDLLHDTYSFTARTLEPTVLIRLSKERVQQALQENPLLRLSLLKMMSWEAGRTQTAFE
ncbi:Crp/Fnr family transcriptional regulator [Pontibacter ramchanderi]|uniref:CRP/FNR family transcriptional regulator n=1 Tax=Pontibacter ramchanderi TaxID=1179743 RepID=A0A2N3V1H1_9BACT|nr:cyclic nucleotide-binding domain-containing protein [Pontibacter ramchanderi]PKV75470.1 CRP/FNR family transcriptional regulator [Pontibacter ramchanderi]